MHRARRLMAYGSLPAEETYDQVLQEDELASYRRRQAQDAKRLGQQLAGFLRRERSRRSPPE